MSSAVPEGWQLAPLSDHASRICSKNRIGNTNVLTASAKDGLINQREYFNKSVASADISHYTLLRKGDFAYNKSYSHGYPVGVVRRLERYDFGVLSPLYICFSIESNECDETYLSYYFDSHRFERELNSVVQEGARAHGLLNIPVNDFFDRELLLPPLPEQKKIASILTAVDEVIENTSRQIDKLQDLKKATMNELLTKGIGHTQFKDSELGRIPKSWEVKSLSEVTLKIGDGIHSTPKYSQDGSFPFINGNNLVDGIIKLGKSTKFVDENEFNKQRTRLDDDTILMSINGTIGNLAVYRGEDVVLGKSSAYLTFINDFELTFAYYLLSSDRVQGYFEDELTGTTIRNLSLKTIRNTPIAVPPISEQNAISNAISSIDSSSNSIQQKLAQTQSLKKSLMQDLLTGKVRVTVN